MKNDEDATQENQTVIMNPKIAAMNGKGKNTILLKALELSKNPEKMQQMLGVKTVAEVYRTLDKLTLRRSYHEALHAFDLDFNYVVRNLKELGDTGNEKTRLGVMQTLLKSMGMDKYDVADTGAGGDWEEVLLKKMEEEKEEQKALPEAPHLMEAEDYEVFTPQMPDSMKKVKEAEKKIGEDLYGKNLYEQ
jgi:hypothetical protein